jgi:hypothetical protein
LDLFISFNGLVLFHKVHFRLAKLNVFKVVLPELNNVLFCQLLLLNGIQLSLGFSLLTFLHIVIVVRKHSTIPLVLGGKLTFHMDRATGLTQKSQIHVVLLKLVARFSSILN